MIAENIEAKNTPCLSCRYYINYQKTNGRFVHFCRKMGKELDPQPKAHSVPDVVSCNGVISEENDRQDRKDYVEKLMKLIEFGPVLKSDEDGNVLLTLTDFVKMTENTPIEDIVLPDTVKIINDNEEKEVK